MMADCIPPSNGTLSRTDFNCTVNSTVHLVTAISTTTTIPDEAINAISPQEIIVIIIYAVVFLFGTVGNIMVIRYFGFKAERKLLFHTYLIHLAVSDLIASIVTPAHFVYNQVTNNTWHLGHAACTIIGVVGPLTVNVSAWLLASIAHERYWGIAKPFKPRFSRTRINTTAGIIWVTSILFMIPYMHAMVLHQGTFCAPSWENMNYELTYSVAILILQSFLPAIFMTVTFTKTLNVLKKRPGFATARKGRRKARYAVSNGDRRRSFKRLIRFKNNHNSYKLNNGNAIVEITLDTVDTKNNKIKSGLLQNISPEQDVLLSDKVHNDQFKNKRSYSYVSKDRTLSNVSKDTMASRDPSQHKAQQSLIMMLIVTFSVFMVCSVPYNVFYVVVIIVTRIIEDYSHMDTLIELNVWLSMLVVANSITNCLVYAGMDKSFRAYCKSFLCRFTKVRLESYGRHDSRATNNTTLN